MPKYRAIKQGFIGRTIQPGEVFDFDGKPGKWMEKIEPVKEAKSQEKSEKSDKPAAPAKK